jgi:hypothetical protein
MNDHNHRLLNGGARVCGSCSAGRLYSPCADELGSLTRTSARKVASIGPERRRQLVGRPDVPFRIAIVYNLKSLINLLSMEAR